MRKALTAVMAGLAVIGFAGPAAAEKPARGCPDSFSAFTRADISARFPNVTQAQFDQVDKNGDAIVCGKDTPGTFNPIDNTSNQ